MSESRKLLAAVVVAAKDRLRRRADVAGTSVLLVLFLFIFSRVWRAVEEQGGALGEYSPSQLVWYLLVAELVVMAPGAAHLRIAEDVRSGDVAIALLRPVSHVHFELARAAGSAIVRLIVLFVVGAVTALVLVGLPRVEAAGVVAGGALVLLAVLASCAAQVLIGLLAFWTEEVRPLYWIWQKAMFVLGGLMLPLDLYPQWLQAVAGALPFRALLFGPARTVVAFDAAFALHAAALLAAWALAFVAALHLVHHWGSRRLQVNGG